MTRKYAYAAFMLFSAAFFFVGCSQEPIFYAIEQEIKLSENRKLAGNVYSIIEINGTVYACNGAVYRKENRTEANGWQDVSLAMTGGTVPGKVVRLAPGYSSDTH